ncbi:MAG: NAD(P)-dependent alcohol dehydrogenase [Ardenticatenaceae bacterium]|nr:NAD(P)-dependent alcohol dehydrogenase [Ardenticatenaceae bacterium]
MKAIVHTKYGPPEVLALRDVENPRLSENEVLVKIHAASINFGDKALVKGEPFLVRLMGYGLLKPKHAIPGGDMAGRVEAVGRNVKQFQPGDEVFADIGGCGFGAFAEYVAVPEDVLVLKPANVTFEEAASVPQAAVVALQGLRDKGQIQPGQKVLINGASGGVGTFAVQIARAVGAEVTAVCSTKNLDLGSSIGADHVIDYTEEDFTKGTQSYDLIFDIVANRSVSDYMQVLTPQGNYVACAFNATSLFLGPFISKKGGKKASSLVHKPNRKDLVFMKALLESGQVVAVIDRCFPLSEVAEGMRWLENGRHHGKVVITMQKKS